MIMPKLIPDDVLHSVMPHIESAIDQGLCRGRDFLMNAIVAPSQDAALRLAFLQFSDQLDCSGLGFTLSTWGDWHSGSAPFCAISAGGGYLMIVRQPMFTLAAVFGPEDSFEATALRRAAMSDIARVPPALIEMQMAITGAAFSASKKPSVQVNYEGRA